MNSAPIISPCDSLQLNSFRFQPTPVVCYKVASKLPYTGISVTMVDFIIPLGVVFIFPFCIQCLLPSTYAKPIQPSRWQHYMRHFYTTDNGNTVNGFLKLIIFNNTMDGSHTFKYLILINTLFFTLYKLSSKVLFYLLDETINLFR